MPRIFIIGRIRIFPKQGDCIHNKPRIAEAALICSLICNKADKLLCLFLQPLKRLDLMPICPCGQNRTGKNRRFIQQDRTQTAVCRLTATLYTAAAMPAQKIDQQQIRLNLFCDSFSICFYI